MRCPATPGLSEWSFMPAPWAVGWHDTAAGSQERRRGIGEAPPRAPAHRIRTRSFHEGLDVCESFFLAAGCGEGHPGRIRQRKVRDTAGIDRRHAPRGDSFRQRASAAGATLMDAGRLVSDEIIIGLVEERIAAGDCANGFLFRRFPAHDPAGGGDARAGGGHRRGGREIAVPDEKIVERMGGRRVHPGSGRTYHVPVNPPEVEGIDDVTGEPLVLRTTTGKTRCGAGWRSITNRRNRSSATTGSGARTTRVRRRGYRASTDSGRSKTCADGCSRCLMAYDEQPSGGKADRVASAIPANRKFLGKSGC